MSDTPGPSDSLARSSRRELAAYFLLAFGFTWLVHASFVLFDIRFSLAFGEPGMLVYKLGLLGPLLGSVAVTGWTRGWQGVRELLGKALRWRFGWRWYLVAVGTVPCLYVLNLLLFHGSIPHGYACFVFPLAPILGQAWVVMAEEFGWRGFALPRLQYLFGPVGAALLLGVIWASWHLPMFFVPGSPQHGSNVLADFTSYVYGMTCFTVVMVVLYNRSGGSVLVGMLFHASLNIAAYVIRIPASIDITNALVGAMALMALWWMPRPWFGRGGAVPGFASGGKRLSSSSRGFRHGPPTGDR
ncbi:MAG: type II CAAX endopeptidase family protein [Pseudomonadota bacterium]